MGLFVCSLNSGSNGNCYYIGTAKDAVLIDAGLSCKGTEKRMLNMGLGMDIVRAIFISHEHTDHIAGVERLASKYQIPVFISAATLQNSRLKIESSLVNGLQENKEVRIKGINVMAFRKFHDASDPHSFVVSYQGISIGIFTDIGRVCKKLVEHFSQCHAAFLETNYDEDMLENGPYPRHLKKRIQGGNGHLSNAQALQLFIQHRNKQLTHLFLSHLSNENNSPKLVELLFRHHARNTQIIVASRFDASGVFEISPGLLGAKELGIIPLRRGSQINLF